MSTMLAVWQVPAADAVVLPSGDGAASRRMQPELAHSDLVPDILGSPTERLTGPYGQPAVRPGWPSGPGYGAV